MDMILDFWLKILNLQEKLVLVVYYMLYFSEVLPILFWTIVASTVDQIWGFRVRSHDHLFNILDHFGYNKCWRLGINFLSRFNISFKFHIWWYIDHLMQCKSLESSFINHFMYNNSCYRQNLTILWSDSWSPWKTNPNDV